MWFIMRHLVNILINVFKTDFVLWIPNKCILSYWLVYFTVTEFVREFYSRFFIFIFKIKFAALR